MAQSDLPDNLAAERREYDLAKAYTEANRPPRRLVRHLFRAWWFFAGLFFILAPVSYAAIMPVLSNDLAAGWFGAWANATTGIAHGLMILLPGLAAGSDSIYGN